MLSCNRNHRQMSVRACLKNHSRNLHAPLCGIFCPNSVAVARYGAFIRTKSPTNCDAHLAESLFQTRSSLILCYNLVFILINAVCRNESSYRRKWIDVAVISNNCSRIQNASASYFYFISEHCAELLHTCFIFSSPAFTTTSSYLILHWM